MKLDEISNPNGRSYYAFWAKALKELLGWSDLEVENWAEKFRDGINDENDFLFHYLPGSYITPIYLDNTCSGWRQKKLSANDLRTISDCMNEFMYPELEKGNGWHKARLRVEAAIGKLGLKDGQGT